MSTPQVIEVPEVCQVRLGFFDTPTIHVCPVYGSIEDATASLQGTIAIEDVVVGACHADQTPLFWSISEIGSQNWETRTRTCRLRLIYTGVPYNKQTRMYQSP